MAYLLARSGAGASDDTLIVAALEATRFQPLSVAYEPTATPMDCFNNVANCCRLYGGLARCGWSLLNLKHTIRLMTELGVPGFTGLDLRGIRGIELETHCVWQRPDDRYVDVTPTDGGENCRFVIDDRVSLGATLHVIVFQRAVDRRRYRQVLTALDARTGRKSRYVERNA